MIQFLIIIQQLIASGTHIVAKGITFELEPAFILLIRSALASLFYIIWLSFRNKSVKKIDKKDYYKVILLGLLNIPLNQFLFLQGLKYTTAPNMALAYALTPAFVLIIAVIFLKEKTNAKKLTGVAIAIIGAAVVLLERGLIFTEDSLLGDFLALAASFSWALYTIIGRNFSIKYGAIYSTGLAMTTGFLLFVPIFLILPVSFAIETITAVNWLQLIYLGVITSGVGYAIWYYALTKTEASKVAVFNNLQPVMTTILSIIFFGTSLTPFFVIGGLLIIGGVYLTQRG